MSLQSFGFFGFLLVVAAVYLETPANPTNQLVDIARADATQLRPLVLLAIAASTYCLLTRCAGSAGAAVSSTALSNRASAPAAMLKPLPDPIVSPAPGV